MSAPSTSGLSVELLLRVIDVKYGYFTLLVTLKRKLVKFPPNFMRTHCDYVFMT